MARIPFVRGLTLLWDALGLGVKSLMFSADVALPEEEKQQSAPQRWNPRSANRYRGYFPSTVQGKEGLDLGDPAGQQVPLGLGLGVLAAIAQIDHNMQKLLNDQLPEDAPVRRTLGAILASVNGRLG